MSKTDLEYTRSERVKDPNIITDIIGTEEGCDPMEGEYSLMLLSSTQPLFLSDGGQDDIELIKEAVGELVSTMTLPEEGDTVLVLKESGEWEGLNWLKYFVEQ